MLRVRLAVCLAFMLISTQAYAEGPHFAEPVQVVFYQNAAQLFFTDERMPVALPEGGYGIVLDLPGLAFGESFSLELEGKPAAALVLDEFDPETAEFETVIPDREQDPARKRLLEKRQAVLNELAGHDSVLTALEARKNLWSVPACAAGAAWSIAERKDLEAAQEEYLPVLSKEIDALKLLIQDAQIRKSGADHALQRYDRLHRRKKAVIACANSDKALRCSYSYVLPAQFSSEYKIFASSKNKTVRMDHSALLSIDAPFLFDAAELILNSGKQTSAIAPSLPEAWEIAAVPPSASKMASFSSRQNVLMLAKTSDAARPAAMPTPEQGSVNITWKLGKRKLDAGLANRILLGSYENPAEFAYTIRPYWDSNAYLTADLALDVPLALPYGRARLHVDGFLVGETVFSFHGNNKRIYFGEDLSIRGSFERISSQSGEKGYISKDQTQSWDWKFTIQNLHAEAERIYVEDQRPELLDERIRLELASTPRPDTAVVYDGEKKPQTVYRWKLTLNPHQSAVIEHKLNISAPFRIFSDRD